MKLNKNLSSFIELRNGTNKIISGCEIEPFSKDSEAKTVIIILPDNYTFTESIRYFVIIKKGLRYARSTTINSEKKYAKLAKDISLDFVTSSLCPLEKSELKLLTSLARTKYIVISDIHMGDSRAQSGAYCWFNENISELQSFLDLVLNSQQIKELIIAGDFFDEWIMPVDVKPFKGSVTNSDEFFESVANSLALSKTISGFNKIAGSGTIRLVYVLGNHDLLLTETTFKRIFPNAVWSGKKSDSGEITGTGVYSPEDGIFIEHGYIYDFYNDPDPLSHPESLIPPGYFVSRMYATTMIHPPEGKGIRREMLDNIFFYASWEIVLYQLFGTIFPKIHPIITGIDGYTQNYDYAQARNNYYDANIGNNWQQRQTINGVYKPDNTVTGLLNGTGLWIWGDLQTEAIEQYFIPNRTKIVVFGHTHRTMIKAYNKNNLEINTEYQKSQLTKEQLGHPAKIYANSGTWVDNRLTPKRYQTRTYLVISPSQYTGSLDTVSLYHYDSDESEPGEILNILLDEVNIKQ